MIDELQARFKQEMINLYNQTVNETKYRPTYFLKMLHEDGGVETARRLLNTDKPSEGYTKLWELGRLDLSVEAVIWENQEYQTLFTKEELKTVEKRLREYEYLK